MLFSAQSKFERIFHYNYNNQNAWRDRFNRTCREVFMDLQNISRYNSDQRNKCEETYSFHAILLSDDRSYDLWLPKIAEGIYYFLDNPAYRFVYFIAENGRWTISCRRPAFFRNVSIAQSSNKDLEDRDLLIAEHGEYEVSIYIEKVLQRRLLLYNYYVSADTEISIGSNANCDICYGSMHISSFHARLYRRKDSWEIYDCSNSNGIYINGEKCDHSHLKLGDTIVIMGLKIIIGTNYLSIASHDDLLQINNNKLQELPINHSGYSYRYEQDPEQPEQRYFNRMPRKRTEIPQKIISVEGPPMSMSSTQTPLMLRMGSSMVMGGAAALAGNFITLLSSVLFPVLNLKYTDKEKQEYEQLRIRKYTEYLNQKKHEIDVAVHQEQSALNKKYPPINELVEICRNKHHLWERQPGDNDFLSLRLGTGIQKLSAVIDYPPKRFELESDDLEEEMYRLVEQPYYLNQVPVILSLANTSVCSLQGPQQRILEYVLQMILQIAVFHSYDEVKMFCFLSEDELQNLDNIRYLPHLWDDQRTIRFIATNETEAYALGEYLKGQIEQDLNHETPLATLLKRRPYYVIFAFNKKLIETHQIIKQILQTDYNLGVSIITAYNDLPKDARKVITLNAAKENIYTTLDQNGSEDTLFNLDLCAPEDITETMRILANTSLKAIEQEHSLPKMITYLEMFHVGRVEQLNPLKRWHENNPITSLAAPIGVSADGSLFMLDLHEKRQGPHGLIAGMTGSGKSEFIITYILSMAINYHPDEVSFVLIDYKGGGLAGAFDNPQLGIRLPHLAGTITNLDGASIQRSLMSIESELVRRQKVFNETKQALGEGTMDIYRYQKLYRAGEVSEPMPHLFIISDEFAELKQQQPEFMEKLISTARIGRSLGIHLILATQKPSGVVNDQIRSNTKFRVCLRVQERSDSMDMLKRPEAAELTDTGRFYLQVGYNEYFAMGQSAWCGAAYEPQDTVPVQRDDTIQFLDVMGQVSSTAKPTVKKHDTGTTQIVAVVKYLSELAEAQGIRTKPLWKPELPNRIDLEVLNTEYNANAKDSMSVCLGKVDDPENQTQFPLRINFETCHNLLIAGESGSGKTIFIQNLLYILASQLSPKDFNFYALDYSSRMLKLFKECPHCGGILCEEDVDSLEEFFKLLETLMSERKKLFSELEVDTFESARKQTTIPLILVIIDNIAGLSTSKQGETIGYKLQNYLKNSVTYGIKYIISCNHLNEVSLRIRQELGERVCLHMRDKYDYEEMLGSKAPYLLPEISGRGLSKFGNRILALQNAILCAGKSENYRAQHIKCLAKSLDVQYGASMTARQLPIISETATYAEFSRQFKNRRIPLGYSKQNGKPIALPLKQFSALSLYFGNTLGKMPIIENIVYAAKRESAELWIIKRKDHSLFDSENEINICNQLLKTTSIFSLAPDSLNVFRETLIAQIAERKTLVQEQNTHGKLTDSRKETHKDLFELLEKNSTPILLLIESFSDFCVSIDSISTLIYNKLFGEMQQANIYAVGCFEPDDYQQVQSRLLYYGFNPEGNTILFGGQFDKQRICDLPEYAPLYRAKQPHYKNRFHVLMMPCGEVGISEIDEDEQSIF